MIKLDSKGIMIRRITRTLLVIAWLVLIFLFSAQPDVPSSQISERASYQMVEGGDCNFVGRNDSVYKEK